MRAATLQGKSLTIRNLPDASPLPGQLLVRPLFTGICGSDLSVRKQMVLLAESMPSDTHDQLPLIIPGHEFSAEIVGIAPGTESTLKTGDIITGLPFTHDHEGPKTIGISPGHGGGLAELTCIDAARSFRIPESIPHDLAALTEPLSVGLHAANLASRNRGPNVVIGCGPVGLSVILSLSLQGRGPILATDISPQRRKAAEALGADIIIDPAEGSALTEWERLAFAPYPMSPLLEREFRGLPPGANIFECTGAQGMLEQVINAAPQHSHIIVAGVCPHEEKIMPATGIVRELTVEFSFAYRPEEFAASLALIEAHPDKAARMITSRQPLANTEAAFDSLASNPSEIKILIDPRA